MRKLTCVQKAGVFLIATRQRRRTKKSNISPQSVAKHVLFKLRGVTGQRGGPKISFRWFEGGSFCLSRPNGDREAGLFGPESMRPPRPLKDWARGP